MVSLAVGAGALGAAAWLILAGHRLLAGVAAVVGAVATLGPTGDRATARRPRLTLAGRLLDRALEGAILAPLAWVARLGSVRVSVLALVGLGASYLASYERARGEALGYRELEGTGYRTLRAAILVGGLLTGWVEASLWAYAALTVSASAVRAGNVARQERRTRAGDRRAGPPSERQPSTAGRRSSER